MKYNLSTLPKPIDFTYNDIGGYIYAILSWKHEIIAELQKKMDDGYIMIFIKELLGE